MVTADLTALEALGIAIRAEADAAELYTEMAARVGNPLLAQKLQLLASEETQHQRMLEHAYRERFPEVPFEMPPSQLPKEISCAPLREKHTLKHILSCAIEEERRSHEFYLRAADRVNDPSGRQMFHFLADWEFCHQMALTAEYEMVTRYPRYFEQAVEAWKPEFRR
jgi:rubrerythrin